MLFVGWSLKHLNNHKQRQKNGWIFFIQMQYDSSDFMCTNIQQMFNELLNQTNGTKH